MNCKICSQDTKRLFSLKVMAKYDVWYYKCPNCFYMHTEAPYWLDEAYGKGAIGALDVGIMARNTMLVNQTAHVLNTLFLDLNCIKGLDYGGGHGIFVRMMRDLGFNFYRQDLYAENLFARYFDIKDLQSKDKFNILTSFEVFEHLINPMEEIQKMFSYSDIIFFSTELQPSSYVSELENWWYIVPEGGQHVSFYAKRTIEEIANKFNAYLYSNSRNLHIISKVKLSKNPFSKITNKNKSKKTFFQRLISKLNNKVNPVLPVHSNSIKLESLTNSDFDFVKQNIRNLEN